MKRRLEDLAALGGRPAFAEPLHVGRPNVPPKERVLGLIEEALDRRWLSNDGPLVRRFEEAAAEIVGAECVAACNGTLALELALRAAGISGDVVVPAFTFVATAHAASWIGLPVVFADVDAATHNIDPSSALEAAGPRCGALLGTHLWGRPCDVGRLEAVAAEAGVPLIFDASHAFGSRGVGGNGLCETYSFHATKFVNCFEGGLLSTRDGAFAEAVRSMRNFGFAGYDRVESAGTNAKMSEASAAMGLASLEFMPEVLAANRRNADAYAEGLDGVPGLRVTPRYDGGNDQYVVVEVDGPLSRDRLARLLWRENVRARRYFTPGVHRMAPYAAQWGSGSFPVTERLCETVMTLPTGTAVTSDDVRTVCELIAFAAENAERLSGRPELAASEAVPF